MSGKKIIVALSAALLGIFVLLVAPAWLRTPADTSTERSPVKAAPERVKSIMTQFEEADETIQTLATQIAGGESPDQKILDGLSREELSREYGQIATATAASGFGHSLLREAVVSRNLPAAQALIAAGADPFFNDNEMAFLAVQMKKPTQRPLWWPDFSPGIDFLNLWLQSGGNPNALNDYYAKTGNLLSAVDPMNLEGVLVLLNAGTDPWFEKPVVLGGVAQNDTWPSFYHMHANVTLTSSELAFRIASAGFYKGGTQEQHAALLAEYDVGIKNILIGGSGPARDRLAWGLQKALKPVLKAMNAAPTSAMQSILAEDLSDVEAGFWLAEGEIRSPDEPSQAVRSDNQWGSEQWNE